MSDWNFYTDNRNQAEQSTRLCLDSGEIVDLPTKWEVCGTCNGEGKHVNPAIDCNGITGEEFAEDPSFADSYWSGVYDVTCQTCQGRTTIKVVDSARCSPEMLEEYRAQARADAAITEEWLAEVRAGC